jgi:hypothetical protein
MSGTNVKKNKAYDAKCEKYLHFTVWCRDKFSRRAGCTGTRGQRVPDYQYLKLPMLKVTILVLQKLIFGITRIILFLTSFKLPE